jgi:hypothetical protein
MFGAVGGSAGAKRVILCAKCNSDVEVLLANPRQS